MGLTPRYRHWIEQAREGKWPTDIICVDCTSYVRATNDPGNRAIEALDTWHAVVLSGRSGYYRQIVESSGQSAKALLDQIAYESRRRGNLWVISYQCVRIWSLLGIWEGIEDERIRICDSDYRNSEAFRERVRRYRQSQRDPLRSIGACESARIAHDNIGYLIVEDPPNILRGRFHGSDRAIQWVDIRNYGINCIEDVMPGIDTARWLARWVTRICHLCDHWVLSSLKATAGSQAMSAWRHTLMTERVHVHTDGRASRIEGSAYCGGRCESRRIGVVECPTWHLDIRSSYGWVCANCPLPTRLVDYVGRDDRSGQPTIACHACCIADVTVETDEPAYPYRREHDIIYPIGRYRTVLCGPELSDALGWGRIREVHAVATYEMGYPLKAYAEHLYDLRCQEEREGVPGSARWVKSLIVSLPGKLGQKNHRWVDCPGIMPQCMYGEWYGNEEGGQCVRYRSIAGVVQRDCVDGFAADAVPSIAAFVTSHARIRLLSAIRKALWHNVYYYDTDSLIVNQEGYERLNGSEFMQHDGMGQLTVRSQPHYLEIRGIKYYVQDKKVTCSGMVGRNIVDLGDGLHYALYLSAVEQSRRGMRPQSVVVHGSYPRMGVYQQGTIGPDGVVSPIVLNEE